MQVHHNDRSTVFLKGLAQEVDDDILFELGIQFGQVVRVHIPMNRLTQQKEEFGFIEFASPADAQYMSDAITNSTAPLRLFGRNVTVSYQVLSKDAAAAAAMAADSLINIGANITISNLERRTVDAEKLRIHFQNFGRLVAPPKIVENLGSADVCSATICFNSFDASDAAIAAFNGQFLFGRKVRVEYALREDGKPGRHGNAEERALWEANKNKTPQEMRLEMQKQIQLKQQREEGERLKQLHQHHPSHQDATSQGSESGAVPQWAQGLNPYTAL